jgi:hypothetical protein
MKGVPFIRTYCNFDGQGIFNWKKHYDVAVTLCNQAIAALAAREAGVNNVI